MESKGIGSAEQPHLVSLVLQSKKALQHGEQLCSRAQSQYNASAQETIEVLALDAKIRWVAEAIVEQLKVSLYTRHATTSKKRPCVLIHVFQLAASVAKCIEEKRAALTKQVKVCAPPVGQSEHFQLQPRDSHGILQERSTRIH